jgi:uncharacterized protein (UPF0332 family)
MSFDWSEYYQLSRELAGLATDVATPEAKMRSAISRAYYAAFCKARDYLQQAYPDDEFPQGADIHYYVPRRFGSSTDKLRKDIADHLQMLRTYRNRADYDGVVRDLNSTTQQALRRANSVLQQLSKLK